MTPLHFAAAQGYIEICHLTIFSLIVNNTDVNPRDDKGNTPLHVAAANGEKEVWKAIASIKLTLEDKIPEDYINPKNDKGLTHLHLTAAKGFLEICQTIFNKLVISNFSKFNPRDNQGTTPSVFSCCTRTSRSTSDV